MTRKIDEMHRRFGVLPGKRCEDCSNLIKGRYHDMILRKCTVYGVTHSEATDWRKKYEACGMYKKDWPGPMIVRTLRNSGMPKLPEEPLEGQTELDFLNQNAEEEARGRVDDYAETKTTNCDGGGDAGQG